jgi:hypothetical protein
MSFDLRVLRKVESEGAWPEIVDGMIGLYLLLYCLGLVYFDDVDGISFFAPSDSGGFRCRGNLSWIVCGSGLYGPSRVAKYAISLCLASQNLSEYGIVLKVVCVSKCCGCDLCSRLCRACDARKRRLRAASAAEGFPHVLSPRSSSDELSYGGIALSRLVSLSPLLPLHLSVLAVIHSLLHYSLTNPESSKSSASGDSHNTSIVSRRIALQPQPQAIHTVNGQITPDPYPVVLRLSRLASLLYGITNTP